MSYRNTVRNALTVALLGFAIVFAGCPPTPTPPTAAFTAIPTTGAAPLTVQFTDQSTPGSAAITARLWDFGDGAKSTNPSHIYDDAGTYTVSLTVTSSVGSDTETKTGYVTVTIPWVTVPNVVGMTQTAAQSAITGAGLTVGAVTDQYSDTVPTGQVISQNPAAGASVAAGTAVTLVVSKVPEPITVPNVVGMTQAAAQSAITGAKLTMGPVTEQYSDTVPTGQVISQNPAGGTSVAPGSAVALVMSKDPDIVIVPNLVGLDESEAQILLTSVGLGVETVTQEFSNTIAKDLIISQAPPANTYAEIGSGVDLVISKGKDLPDPVADFMAFDTSGYAPRDIRFSNQSVIGQGNVLSWEWYFGDGGTSNDEHPIHTYEEPGSYDVTLVVTTTTGADEDTKNAYITLGESVATEENVIVLAPETGWTLNQEEDGDFVVTPIAASKSEPVIESGDYVVGRGYEGTGHLFRYMGTKRYVSDEARAKTVMIIGTDTIEYACVHDLVEQGSIAVNFKITEDDFVRSGIPVKKVVGEKVFIDLSGKTIYDSGGLRAEIVHGTLGLNLDGDFVVDLGFFKVDLVRAFVEGRFDLEVDLCVDASRGFDVREERNLLPPVIIPVHAELVGIPVWLEIVVEFKAGIDVNVDGAMLANAGFEKQTELRLGAEYRNGNWYDLTYFHPRSSGHEPALALNGSLDARLYLRPELRVALYSTAVPYLAAETYLGMEGSYAPPSRCVELFMGMDAELGFALKILAFTLADWNVRYNVWERPLYSKCVDHEGPTATFTASPRSGEAPLTVSFTDQSTEGSSAITNWAWDFGDGGTSADQNPSHTYDAGTYTVSLTVTTVVDSSTETKTDYISGSVGPTADFTGSPLSGEAPLTVTFTDQSDPGSSPITSWAWDFGDGGTSTIQNPSHTCSPGTYTVSLTVTTSVGSDTETKIDYISGSVGPTADFTGSPRSGEASLEVTFTDQSTPGSSAIISWAWNFGDGGTSADRNPSHTYTTDDVYTVSLTVTTVVGSDTKSEIDYITVSSDPVGPTAAFTASPLSGEASLAVDFTDESAPGSSPIDTWAWDFGDAGTSADQNPSHTYDAGTYTVTLTVTTDVGSDTKTESNYITVSVPLMIMISVPAGSFTMGRRFDGDDGEYGAAAELPQHNVLLSAYRIGKCEVTNQQVCDVYNWANGQGYFTTVDASKAEAFGHVLLNLDSSGCPIEYAGGLFSPETRTGLPGTTTHSMADHPVVGICWYGAAAYCNWLSEMLGLTPLYDTSTWTADFSNDGYHLPTEAQWERAAAWDGAKHWIYGFTSDSLIGKDRCNYTDVNPLGLTTDPRTSPVGWFDGLNVSPNGNVLTLSSLSPVGCYDMSANVYEFCHDWYSDNYYATGEPPWIDPTGPGTGESRVHRGGCWNLAKSDSRSASRNSNPPDYINFQIGFRVARTP